MNDTTPRDFEALKTFLVDNREQLPKRLKQVAAFALERPDEIAFGTAAHIAELAEVQPSTLVRFAQAVGYSGFSELQQVFQAHMRGGWPTYRDRVAALKTKGGDALTGSERLIDGFARAALASIDRLRVQVEPQALDRAIERLAAADTIYLLGVRRVFPIVAYMAYAFGKLGIRATLVDHVAQLGPEQIAGATPRDAVLAVSFTPYARATLDLATAAAEAGVPVVAVTDSSFSPLAAVADVWLEATEADFASFRSLTASMVLAMTLAVGVAEKREA